jgi:BirA family transcriptional regulator, biotin operon repressor / biotin---[acetyl-CoA-carboxylase] ligase
MSETAPALPDGYRLRHYEAVGSSNDEAKVLARAGAPSGTIIWADRQTAGRGRRGRAWESPPGNLYFSLLLRPDAPPSHIAQLSFVAALGLGGALGELAGAACDWRCKWPNDLLVNGKKLAGILLESETSAAGRVDFIVIGIGVNLMSAPVGTAYPATSLAAEESAGVRPAGLLAAFLRHFDRWRERWQEAGFAPVREAWLERAAGLGEPIRVRLDRTTLTGRFIDLDADGALVLRAADGCRKVAAGEVFPVAA